jgi:hypothetical protein
MSGNAVDSRLAEIDKEINRLTEEIQENQGLDDLGKQIDSTTAIQLSNGSSAVKERRKKVVPKETIDESVFQTQVQNQGGRRYHQKT